MISKFVTDILCGVAFLVYLTTAASCSCERSHRVSHRRAAISQFEHGGGIRLRGGEGGKPETIVVPTDCKGVAEAVKVCLSPGITSSHGIGIASMWAAQAIRHHALGDGARSRQDSRPGHQQRALASHGGWELSLLAVRRSRPPRDLRVDSSEWTEDPREMRRVRVGGMVGQEAMLQRPSGTHALLHLRP